jgi:hypothetical protein
MKVRHQSSVLELRTWEGYDTRVRDEPIEISSGQDNGQVPAPFGREDDDWNRKEGRRVESTSRSRRTGVVLGGKGSSLTILEVTKLWLVNAGDDADISGMDWQYARKGDQLGCYLKGGRDEGVCDCSRAGALMMTAWV